MLITAWMPAVFPMLPLIRATFAAASGRAVEDNIWIQEGRSDRRKPHNVEQNLKSLLNTVKGPSNQGGGDGRGIQNAWRS
jgi:hypothetical protein